MYRIPRISTEKRMNLQGIDAFLALSQVYLDCAEHLAQNTVAVSRGAIEECAVAAKVIAAGNAAADVAPLPAGLSHSLLEKAFAYTRDSYETITSAQLQSAQILGQQFGMPAIGLPFSNDWKGAFDMFAQPFRDLSTTAEAVVAEAAGRARASSSMTKTVTKTA